MLLPYVQRVVLLIAAISRGRFTPTMFSVYSFHPAMFSKGRLTPAMVSAKYLTRATIYKGNFIAAMIFESRFTPTTISVAVLPAMFFKAV